MRKLEFLLANGGGRSHDAALVSSDEDPREALIEAAIQHVSTEVEITVGGVTMHLAGWQDPDHWSEDWAERLGVDHDDVDAAVEALIDGEIKEEE